MTSKTAVRVTGLTKHFGSVEALREINLAIHEGELFGFIGADGAGKTTLFRILCALLLPDKGNAEVLGFDTVTAFREIRKRIGYMPGRFSLYQDLSVEENLRFFATVFGTTIKANYELIKDIYSQLEPFRNRMAGKLSGGMKQKLALSCALVHRPELLLLDEPTTGVDAVSRREFWQMLGKLQKKGITILVSTPYMDEAALCDRIAFLQNGATLGIDTPKGIVSLFTRPLYAVRSLQKHILINTLRQYEHAASVYAFGSCVHYTDKRPSLDQGELQAYLTSCGLNGVQIEHIEPSIEDTFIALLEEKGGLKNA